MSLLIYLKKSILMPYHAVFIVKAIVRTGIIRSLNETCHFIFVKIHHAYVAVVALVIDIVGAGLAVCSIFLIHIILLYVQG